MSGSKVIINMPAGKDNVLHNNLLNRNLANQHIMESIYEDGTGKNLVILLNELRNKLSSVLDELIVIDVAGTNVVTLTKFQYNPSRDTLLVQLNDNLMFCGVDYDYIKSSPNTIQFNYNLNLNDKVYILVIGTITNESFGDDVYSSLTQFKQLIDTPSNYYGKGGLQVVVNNAETGLVFRPSKAVNNYITLEQTYILETNGLYAGWLNFLPMCTIKSIKLTPTSGYLGNYNLSIWSSLEDDWIYYSGSIETILYDIMDIPHIDQSGNNQVYIELRNLGPASEFKLKMFLLE